MTDYSTTSLGSKSAFPWGRLLRYLALGLVANAIVWSFALTLLKGKKPTYTSNWTMTIPAGVRNTNVNLPGLGSASEQSRSPFAFDAFDPRENYKTIIASEQVLDAAKNRLSGVKVGKPRIEIIDNTTMMDLSITGGTAEEAQKKAQALNEAFQVRLNELRLQESARQEVAIQSVLGNARKKLKLAQEQLSDYKARSGFVSDTQIVQLSSNIEELRKQRALAVASQRQAGARLSQLSSNLKLSPPQAGEAFVLKADPLFQKYLQNYSEANANLLVLNSKLGPNHPLVLRERSRQDAARSALLSRSQSILNRPLGQEDLARLNIGEGSTGNALEGLFQNLVIGQVDQQGLTAQADELNRQILELESRLGLLAKQGATLEALTRDMQIAETIFSSTLARLDVSKLDAFGSYPSVEVLKDPSLPDSPSDPNKKAVLLGSTLCSLFILSALVSFWTRRRWLPSLAGVRSERSTEPAFSEPSLLPPSPKSEVRSN